MRARQVGKWLLLVSSLLLVAACQSTQLDSVPPVAASAITPLAMFEVTAEAETASAPALTTASGVYLTAYISPICPGTVRSNTGCVQPYAGEFVVTELNGAVVTDVMTNNEGQVIIHLPPGKYILGAKTESVYPLAAPVKVDVLSDQYVHILINLDSGLGGQAKH